ncbi:hypothetical protein WICMUC_000673 [Wickerhamomyces mucosus]|uniref:BRCT domain-containing protein n=1 Tax=Wickerhamomyces mucosus TaxID=1378264 RepID=A0A9P8PYH5_9ASCO|nr:hypothetical protein WICMUC_000673 [Wickerhamomyces mucosus]
MRSLFENFKILILESSELPSSEVEKIVEVLKQYSVPVDIDGINSKIKEDKFIEAKYTHVVSNTANFKLYRFTQEKLIPVVTADFIHKINEWKRQPSIRPFSPNPEHVLKDITVCVGGLPDSDKEAICGGVRALGGSFSETLNKFVTHLISVDLDEDCCIVVKSIDDPKIQIVVPNWIDDCIKLRKRLDETPYLLIDDELKLKNNLIRESAKVELEQLSVKSDKVLDKRVIYFGKDLEFEEGKSNIDLKSWIKHSGGTVTKRLSNADIYLGKYRDGLEYVTAMKNKLTVASLYWIYWIQEHKHYSSPYLKLLHHPWVRGGLPEMKDFVIASTNYTGDARQYVTKLVEALGGKFTTTMNRKNTHLIAASPVGKKYETALKWGEIKIVNHLWLEESYANWSLKPITHPRYNYFPNTIKLSDVIGETPLKLDVLEKFYQSGEIEHTTHIVEDSEDEGILSDSAVALNKELLENDNDSSIGENHIVSPIVANEDTNRQSIDTPEPTSRQKTDNNDDNNSISQRSNTDKDVLTPKKDLNVIDRSSQSPVKENLESNVPILQPHTEGLVKTKSTLLEMTRSRPQSNRKAKNQASEKLHADMEELNFFQKQNKSGKIPLLPSEIEERKRRREEEKLEKTASKSRASSAEPDHREMEQERNLVKKFKKEKTIPSTKYHINAIITGWENGFSKTDISFLSKLGIHLYSELRTGINTIASPKMMRTEKFLIALSYNLEHIINPDFFKHVIKEFKAHPNNLENLPDPNEYSLALTDDSSVKEATDIKLDDLLERCRERYSKRSKIFKDLNFNIISKLAGGSETISRILKAHGAQEVKVFKSQKDLKKINSLKFNKYGSFIFISNDKGYNDKLITLIAERDDGEIEGKIVEWDWVVSSIFKMAVQEDSFIVFSKTSQD